MESSLFVVAMALLSAVRAETGRTLDDYFREKEGRGVVEYFDSKWYQFTFFIDKTLYEADSTHDTVFTNLTSETLQYSEIFYYEVTLEFFTSVANVTEQSVRQDIHATCGEYLDNWTESTNMTCMKNSLKKWFQVEFEKALEVALKKFSRECSLHICSRTPCDFCTSAFGERFAKNSVNLIVDAINWINLERENSTSTYLYLLYSSIFIFPGTVAHSLHQLTNYHYQLYSISNSVPSIEPFKYDNLLRVKFIHIYTILDMFRFTQDPVCQTQQKLDWGIIRSTQGNLEHTCSVFRDIYTWESYEYHRLSYSCYFFNALQSHIDLIHCYYKDEITAPLSWTTDPSVFFHSQCLCLAYNGSECGVKAPEGVEPLTYCLSVLLADFQKQVSFRPALTYLDYSFMTKVPICQFTSLLQHSFYKICRNYVDFEDFDYVLSVQCSFYGLVNDTVNCSEISMINSYNATFLCDLYFFVSLVNCDANVDASVPFYSPGASTLVQFLTYMDVCVRTLTLVTYLSCPQLRNLPGKLLIGYQVTALLRLLVVRASLEDLAVAVRIDVASDFSSTLWLTSFLHFLTSSFKTLRLPDSLSPQEARVVLLRYSLFGWALPAALSASFFFLDEAFHTHVQCGQLLFVFCYYVALVWNLYMFYHDCKFYYDVKKGAVPLKPGVKARTVFTGLFNFALKTSVLSGAGIIFRLLFTQIQGLEELLGYYHALGTLQGLLVFLFYGCNRESREFWRRVLSQKLLPCLRPQNRVV